MITATDTDKASIVGTSNSISIGALADPFPLENLGHRAMVKQMTSRPFKRRSTQPLPAKSENWQTWYTKVG